MPRPRAFRELRLLNGSTGDPCLFVNDQGRDNALLIDCGDNAVLGDDRLADLEAVSRGWALIACIRWGGPSQPNMVAGQSSRVGNKMGTGLAISAQCGCNVRASGQYRNCLAIKALKYHRNVFPTPLSWQTRRTQNPTRLPAARSHTSASVGSVTGNV